MALRSNSENTDELIDQGCRLRDVLAVTGDPKSRMPNP